MPFNLQIKQKGGPLGGSPWLLLGATDGALSSAYGPSILGAPSSERQRSQGWRKLCIEGRQSTKLLVRELICSDVHLYWHGLAVGRLL